MPISADSKVYRFYRFLGSIWLLLILLVSILGILAAADTIGGIDMSAGALRRDWYGSWWFNIIMGLLMVNLTVCTVIRKPWRDFWRWGFLITHTGILTLMIGSAVTFNSKIYGDMQLAEGAAQDWFEIENERQLVVVEPSGHVAKFDINHNRYLPSKRRTTFDLPETKAVVTIDEFRPSVDPAPAWGPAAAGVPVIELAINNQRAFLPADQSLEFGPMLDFQFRELSDYAFDNLTAPSPEKGTFTVTLDGETRDLDVAAVLGKPEAFAGGEVTVHDFRADQLAVVFEVKREGTSRRLLATALADGALDSATGRPIADPKLSVRLRAAPRASRIQFLLTETGLKYICFTSGGKKLHGPVAAGTKIDYPLPQAKLTVDVVQFIKSAEETVRDAPPKKTNYHPAIRLTIGHGAHRDVRWVTFGEPREFMLGQDLFRVGFIPRRFENLPFTLRLLRFDKPNNPGTTQAASFRSDVVVEDKVTGGTMPKSILVNEPYTVHGYVIYQASYSERPDGSFISVLQIAWDPGKKIIYLGALMAVSGTIFMFFFQPFLKKLIKAGARAEEPPMSLGTLYALLLLGCAGTIGGSVAFMLNPGINGVFLGLGILGADILLVFVAAWIAQRARPGRALQIGQVMSTSWCINTAAFVIFMWMRVGG